MLFECFITRSAGRRENQEKEKGCHLGKGDGVGKMERGGKTDGLDSRACDYGGILHATKNCSRGERHFETMFRES